MRVLGVVVGVWAAATLAGCSHAPAEPPAPAPAPASAPVSTEAECGVRQVFWGGHWWVAAGPAVFGAGSRPFRPVTPVSGTVTVTGPGRATLASPQLPRLVELAASPERRPDRPPLGICVQ